MQAQLLKPLRAVLGLPQSAHSHSVLVEFGIPPLKRYWEQQLLLFHARACILAHLTVKNPLASVHPTVSLYVSSRRRQGSVSSRAHSLFDERREDLNQMSPRRAASRGDYKFRAFDLTPKLAHKSSIALSFQDWRDAKEGGLFRNNLKRTAGPSSYLWFDAKPVAALRARLRFARSTINEHRYDLGLADSESSLCEMCRSASVESVEHLLCHCAAYKQARTTVRRNLRSHRPAVTLSVKSALGEYDNIPTATREAALEATGRFLMAIHSIRAL